MGFDTTTTIGGQRGDFCKILVEIDQEKLVDLGGVIEEEIQGGKFLVHHQALRVLKYFDVEIEEVFMMFYFIDLALFVCV